MSVSDDIEPLARRTTASLIADRIRSGIMSGRFKPGAQLGEVDLSSRLRVSRGPVREALQRLIQEGLLRSEPNRGVFVIELAEDDVVDIYVARRAVEGAAALLLMQREDSEGAEALDKIVGEMAVAARRRKWDSVADLDISFHECLVAVSQSKRLERVLRTLLAETRMCLTALEPAYPVRDEIVSEHREIVEAIRERDEERAVRLINEHMDSAVKHLTGGRRSLPVPHELPAAPSQ